VVKAACAAGYTGYLSERLLAARGPVEADATASGPALRRWGRADAYPAFRLYNRWTPEPVRRVEAATFREWLASRERASPTRGTRQWVIEGAGRIDGWLRTAADGEVGRFDLLADPSAPELLEPLIDLARARLSEQSALLTLAPAFAEGLCERLERRGFTDQGEFVVLARQTTRPVAIPELAPAAPVQSFPA
jgi:hypothetical protein